MANKKRSERIFEIGDLVYLKLQPYQQKTIAHIISQKLASKVHTWFWRE
jgi:exosome complex RNA-binding protein Rrp4